MLISYVKTCEKVANVVLNTGTSKAKIVFDFIIDKKRGGKQGGIVYLFVVNKVIYKIGYTRSKDGIKGALTAYQGGIGGSPSLRTYGIHILLHKELKENSIVEVYAIFSNTMHGKVKGLFKTYDNIQISPSHEMEDICKKDYIAVEKKYPKWNFKENGEDFPNYIQVMHAKQLVHQKSKRNRK